MKSSRTCVYMVDSIHEISAEGRGEVERMLQGELYDPSVKALAEMRDVMQEKQRRYSNLNDRKERTKMIKSLFYSTGEDVTIEPNFFADYGKFISVGERFYANFNCCFLDGGGIEIGDDVMLAPNVSIYTAHHPLQSDIRHGTGGQKALELCHKVKIGNRVWVGGHAIINPGVTIGDDVVIGSGSVVTRDIEAGVVVAGNPARVIRKLGRDGRGSKEDDASYVSRRTSSGNDDEKGTEMQKFFANLVNLAITMFFLFCLFLSAEKNREHVGL